MENASENAIVKSKMQLVCNTVNMDSSELDRLYPESINKTKSANSELRGLASRQSRYHSRVRCSELRSEGKLSCILENQVATRNSKSRVKIYNMTHPKGTPFHPKHKSHVYHNYAVRTAYRWSRIAKGSKYE